MSVLNMVAKALLIINQYGISKKIALPSVDEINGRRFINIIDYHSSLLQVVKMTNGYRNK